jgi:hypothetical protein
MALTQITYSNKETLNEQPSIADINKVTADNMNEIKSVVNNGITTIDRIISGEVYSTDEVKTNKVWIDNKPIYRKCIANGSSATNGSKFSLNSISNIDTITNIISKEVRTTGAEIFGNYYDGTSNKFTLQYYSNNNEINTWAGSEQYIVTIFVEYTKTTD